MRFEISVWYWENGKKKLLRSEGGELGVGLVAEENSFSLVVEPCREFVLDWITVEVPFSFNREDWVYVNGFQSWTDSREWARGERMKGISWLYFLAFWYYRLSSYGDYSFASYSGRRGVFQGFTYTYVRRGEGITLMGSLSERSGYTIFECDMAKNRILVHKDCKGMQVRGKTEMLSWVTLSGAEGDVFETYFRRLGCPRKEVAPCTGWTSWYHYYEKITQDIVLENLEAFAREKVPVDVFQIDDGYQQAVGDWLSANHKFPEGMKAIARRVHEAGYKAGLWLAPFICEEKSALLREHPDFVLKDENGKRVVAGYNPFNWSGQFYALDFYHPPVREYLKKVFDTVLQEWGFDLVKLDFLYAVAMIPHAGRSRGQIMQEAMDFLREAVGEKEILGCGVPLGPAFGKVDYCRIGSDVGLFWEDRRLARMGYRERVSTYNSLTSTIGRRHLNGHVFLNDPDVFILREKKQRMSLPQRKTLFLLNLIFGGLVFTSDNLAEYGEEEKRTYRSQFPVKPKTVHGVTRMGNVRRVDFQIEEKRYVAFSNLGSRRENFSLESGVYFEKGMRWIEGGKEFPLGPYASVCFLKAPEGEWGIAGSDGHIFPGSEVDIFHAEEGEVTLGWHRHALLPEKVYLKIPDDRTECNVNGKVWPARKTGAGLTICAVEPKGQGDAMQE